jgi:transposase
MDRYIGLDVHSQSCTLVVIGPTGRQITERIVETNGRSLVEAVRDVPVRRHLCFEEGSQSAWLYELLEPHVDEIVVVRPEKRTGCKSDSSDAAYLAEELRSGKAKRRVFKAPGMYTSLREAERTYRLTRRELVRAKNRLKALFRSRGVLIDEHIYETKSQPRLIRKLPAAYRPRAELLALQLEAAARMHAQTEKWLHEEASRCSAVSQLETMPGIGIIRAAQIVATVVVPHRFRTKRQFWSYCGFGIVTRSSADWVRDSKGNWVRRQVPLPRGLNANRNPILKEVFKGAAKTIIGHMPGHPLHLDYQRMLQDGIKPNLAHLTIARRLAAVALAIWKHKEDYDPAKHRTHAAA